MSIEKCIMMRKEFDRLSTAYEMQKSFGYFIDKQGTTVLAYNKIDDDQMLYMVSRIVKRIARKHNAKYSEVMSAVAEWIEDYA